MPGIRLHSPDWSIQRTPVSRAGGRRSAADTSSFPAEYLSQESEVAEEFTAQPKTAARRQAAPTGALDFSYWPTAKQPYLPSAIPTAL
jgi:hypothetical protein